MSNTQLIIGNRNYSSWSLRAWLAMRLSDLPFECVRLSLDTEDFERRIIQYSPARRVPVLVHEGVAIWDSIAIVEYLAELRPTANIWPAEHRSRILARFVCAEMHGGFNALRNEMPMNCRARGRKVPMTDALRADIEDICRIWHDCRALVNGRGAFLFGEFSAADAFFAPVAMRFLTYRPPLRDEAMSYVEAIRHHPWLQEWCAAARAEPQVIEREEVGMVD